MEEPLDLQQLEPLIDRLAARIEAPEYTLPAYGSAKGDATPYIDSYGGLYHWVVSERGQEFEHRMTAELDELLYWVFQSVTFYMALIWATKHRDPLRDFRRARFQRQLDLLGQLEPRWRGRCAQEIETILAKHPYVDGEQA